MLENPGDIITRPSCPRCGMTERPKFIPTTAKMLGYYENQGCGHYWHAEGINYTTSTASILEQGDGKDVEPAEAVNHPRHYNVHPSGVECIDVVEHMSFNLGNAVKYVWRAGEKGDHIEDLKKAVWYVNREIQKLTGDRDV